MKQGETMKNREKERGILGRLRMQLIMVVMGGGMMLAVGAASSSLVVTITPSPSGLIAVGDTNAFLVASAICSGTNVTTNSTTYSWAGGGITNTSIQSITTLGETNISLTATHIYTADEIAYTNTGTTNISVTIVGISNIIGATNVLAGSTNNYTVTPEGGSTFPSGWPKWETNGTAMSGTTASNTVVFPTNAMSNFTVTATVGTSTTNLNVNVIKVTTSQDSGQKYGYDKFSSSTQNWKSIRVGYDDSLYINVKPDSLASLIDVHVTSLGSIDTSTLSTSPQLVTVTANASGNSEMQARFGQKTAANLGLYFRPKITKVVMFRVVNCNAYTSTDVSYADVKNYLDKVYGQAILGWAVVKLPAITVDFDLDGDGKFDVYPTNSSYSITAEMQKVIDEAKDDTYTYNIFIVNRPNDESFGYMPFGQPYGFVHPDFSPSPETTVSHELGHGAFSLSHASGLGISSNIMTQGSQNKWLLFKNQWEDINP